MSRERICRRAALLSSLVLLSSACAGTGSQPSEGSVVAAFYPLAFAARTVAGDRLEVVNLTPPGAEPHDLELSTAQMRTLASAELVVYVGGGFQPALEDALAELEVDRLDVLEAVSPLPSRGDPHGEEAHAGEEEAHAGEEEAHAGEEEAHAHPEGAVDPHVWLDPLRMARIVRAIGAALAGADPDGGEGYRARAADLARRLEALHEDYREGLSGCERREIVVSHEAFGYLADRYDLRQLGIAGLDPEAEPAPGRVAEVTRFAREHGVTTIFFERAVSPEVAEVVAAEIGVRTAVLDPLEFPPRRGDYFDVMRANLLKLKEALGC